MRKPTRREAIIGGISLTVTITLSLLIIHYRSFLDQIAEWGYFGCFFINVLTNGTFILPGFGIVITFTLGGVLNPLDTLAGDYSGIVTTAFTSASATLLTDTVLKPSSSYQLF